MRGNGNKSLPGYEKGTSKTSGKKKFADCNLGAQRAWGCEVPEASIETGAALQLQCFCGEPIVKQKKKANKKP